jgi:protein-S-isoprenylcysteine O-methyltransferase Ste14
MYLYWANASMWLAWLVYWFVAALFVSSRKFTEGHFSRLLHTIPLGIGFWLIFHGGGASVVGRLVKSPLIRWVGTALAVFGLSFTVWARVHLGKYWSGIITLKEDHKLIRTGPYQLVRHPIYTGFVVAALGSALAIGTGDALIGFGLILAALVFKIHREEAVLIHEFGDEYRVFQTEVAALLPFVW